MAGIGYHKSGAIGFVDMPKVERYRISAYLSMIDNTPFEETDKQITYIATCAEELKRELIDPGTGQSLVRNIMTSAGASRWGGAGDPEQGFSSLEIMPPSERSEPGPTNAEIAKMWEDRIGEIKNLKYPQSVRRMGQAGNVVRKSSIV